MPSSADAHASPYPTSAVRDLMTVLAGLGEIEPAASGEFIALLSPRRFEKDEWLLRGGERTRLCYFIARGLVRELYVDAAGAEHTRSFLPEGFFTGSLVDLLSGAPAITWIQALEPTETLAFPYADYNEPCNRYPSLDRVGRRFAEALYVRKVMREYQLLALSAQERYQAWMEGSSTIDARVRRRDVASYLGVTAEHLSRLRARRKGGALRARVTRKK